MKNKLILLANVIKIKVYCHTGFTNCNHDYIEEIDSKTWNKMTKKKREEFLDELAETNMANNIEYGAYALTDDNEE